MSQVIVEEGRHNTTDDLDTTDVLDGADVARHAHAYPTAGGIFYPAQSPSSTLDRESCTVVRESHPCASDRVSRHSTELPLTSLPITLERDTLRLLSRSPIHTHGAGDLLWQGRQDEMRACDTVREAPTVFSIQFRCPETQHARPLGARCAPARCQTDAHLVVTAVDPRAPTLRAEDVDIIHGDQPAGR